MYRLRVEGDFSSAHFLRDYEGKCKHLHGHNWLVRMTVCGEKLDHRGMLVDFKDLRKNLRETLSRLDHGCLNEIPPFDKENPTAENLAKWVFEQMSGKVGNAEVERVEIFENSGSVAEYSPK